MCLTDDSCAVTDLLDALRMAGLRQGDVAFFQVSYESLGILKDESYEGKLNELIYAAMRKAVGTDGTLIVPSFSFSFVNSETFDIQSTPGVSGSWSASGGFLEYFRRLPGAVRSSDPNCSVVALGPMAEELVLKLPTTSYGEDCIYERLLKAGGKLCGIGARIADTPFLCYVEEAIGARFRYKKLFTGQIQERGIVRKHGWITSVPNRAESGSSHRSLIEGEIRSVQPNCIVHVGAGEVFSLACDDVYRVATHEIGRHAGATVQGQASKMAQLEDIPAIDKTCCVDLTDNAPMKELIAKLWRLPRDIVSDGYDAALRAISTQIPMTIHEYPTGTECWTWIVPEKWTCHQAWLERLDGQRLFSYNENPLHVVSYSLPINREVSRQELFEHLHVHPKLPDAIPFIFKYYERDWGLCCSKNLKDALKDDCYRVVINSEVSCGSLKVGEVVVPGQSRESFVLCAHLCHPAMVNDDLTGVVVGLKVMQELLRRPNLKYTYRFLILPETIGSVAYLSHHEELIPEMVGGLFLEMLGLDNPHALQLSFAGDTEVDRCLTQVLKESDPSGWTGPFRTVVGNDERQFNAPGVRVPMLSLSRVQPRGQDSWPYYAQYHSSADTPACASLERLEESRDMVLKMIDAFEADPIPVNLYKGEIFCSRFGLNIDVYANPAGNRALFDIIFLIDGTRSVAEIARVCNIPLESAKGVVEELRRLGLVEYRGALHNKTPE